MTYKQAFAGAEPAEVERRHAVIVRINKLWDKQQTADPDTFRKCDRQLKEIKRTEAHWLKTAAFFFYC